MVAYIRDHPSDAGLYIYKGYKNAWASLGYEVNLFSDILELNPKSDDYIMAVDADIKSPKHVEVLNSAKKAFVHVQPTEYCGHWSRHPNFVTQTTSDIRRLIREVDSIKAWSFVNINRCQKFYEEWEKDVQYVPLAFDNIEYPASIPKRGHYNFDVCYVGGWANNGFGEKERWMKKVFSQFMNSGLRCGFFINKGLSTKKEQEIIRSTLIPLNLHDDYQRVLGFDTNERTFKSLGINGCLVSDYVEEASSLLGKRISFARSPEEIVQKCVDEIEVGSLRTKAGSTILEILEKHTYIERVKSLLS